jgi:hypothetical protein
MTETYYIGYDKQYIGFDGEMPDNPYLTDKLSEATLWDVEGDVKEEALETLKRLVEVWSKTFKTPKNKQWIRVHLVRIGGIDGHVEYSAGDKEAGL